MPKKRNRAVKSVSADEQSTVPLERSLDPFEAVEQVQDFVKETGQVCKNLGKAEDRSTLLKEEVRWRGYAMIKRKGPEVAEKPLDFIWEHIKEGMEFAMHISTANRHWNAGIDDAKNELPFNAVKESVHRCVRSDVEEDHHKEVIEKAREERGSYKGIQANDITRIAEALEFLKSETEQEGDEEPDVKTGKDSAEDDAWTPKSSGHQSAKESKAEKRKRIQEAGRDLPEKLSPVYKTITDVPRNIPAVIKYLEIAHANTALSKLIGRLGEDDIWTLIGRLQQVSAKPQLSSHDK